MGKAHPLSHARSHIPNTMFFWLTIQLLMTIKTAHKLLSLTHRNCKGKPNIWILPLLLQKNNASINSSGAHAPPGNRGAFAYVVSPGGWALAYPRATPGHLTHVFSKDGWVETFVKDRLVRQGLEKPVDVFKGMFSQFYIFLHYL